MDPIITSLPSPTEMVHGESDRQSPTTVHYKKVNVPLAYPSEAIREQSNNPKTYVYPPLMSPSDEYFHQQQQQSSPTSPTTSQPINILQGRNRMDQQGRQGGGGAGGGLIGRRNSLPVRTSASLPASMVTTTMATTTAEETKTTILPSPPSSPWRRATGFTKPLTRSTTVIVDETPYPELPTD
ncbi:hypothetical protein BGZ65_009834, partial [Modicella reniformis]